MYYSEDGGPWEEVQDINDYAGRFNLTTWFGAYSLESNMESTGENSTADRYYKGTLSNLYIKLAKDDIVNYTITFDGNGGTPSFDSKLMKNGSAIGSLPTAEKDGYFLEGWYTEETGGRKIDETETVMQDM